MSDRVINLYFKKPFNGTIDVNNQTTLGTGSNSLIFTVSINDTNYIKMGNTKTAGTLTLPSDLLTAPSTTSNKPNLLLFEVSGGVFLSANTFSECSSLQMVDLYNMGNIFIPPTCFRNCTSLNTVIFPYDSTNSIKVIDISANAFAGCSSLTTLHFPSTDNLDIINSSAFDNLSTRRINLYDTSARANYVNAFPAAKGNIVYGNSLTIFPKPSYTPFYSGLYNGADFSYNSSFGTSTNAKSVTSGNTSVITVDNATGNTNVNIINAGLTFIKANTFITGLPNQWPSALSVVYIGKANTTVSGTTIYNQPYTPSQITLNLSSAGSGAITYTSNNTNLFTVSGTSATILGIGSGTITATIAETSNYNAGSQVISLTITQFPLSLTVGNPTVTKEYLKNGTYSISSIASISSNSVNVPIIYTSSDTNIATISTTNVILGNLGTTTITATQNVPIYSLHLTSTTSNANLSNKNIYHLTTVSIECWVKIPVSLSNATGYPLLMGKWGCYGIFLNGGRLVGYNDAAGVVYFTDIHINDATWHHVALTRNSSSSNNTILYLDGLSVLTYTSAIASANNGFSFGGPDDNSHSSEFQIFNARVWNITLTQSQIQTNMNTIITSETGLIGSYMTTQTTGTTVTNAVDGTNNLTINGTYAWVIDNTFTNPNYTNATNTFSLTVTTATCNIYSPTNNTRYAKNTNSASFSLDISSNNTDISTFTCVSSDTSIITVNNTGQVTLVGNAGTASITISQSSSTNFNAPSNNVVYVDVSKNNSTITVTTPATLSVILTDKTNTYYQIAATSNNTDNSTITYSTSNPYIATVNATGNVYILAPGTATITLSSTETSNFYAATPVNCTIYSSIKPSTSDLYTYKGTPLNEYLMIDTGYPEDSSFNSAYNTEISSKSFSVIRRTNSGYVDTDPSIGVNFVLRYGERVLYIAADDSSYYSVINTGESITIEMYVNLESLYVNSYVCLIKKPKEYAVWANQNSIQCYNYNTNSFTSATTSTNLNVGWKHIAFTYTNTNDNTNNASVYINGSQLFTCNLQKSTTALTATDYFSIGDALGNLPTTSTFQFNRIFGVYGLRIWPNTIRTASEIASYYNVISPILGVDQYLLKEQTYTNSANILNSNTSSSISYLTIQEYVVNDSVVNSFTESVWVNNNDYPLGYINHFIKYDSVNTGSKFEQTNYFNDINNTEYGARYIQYVGNANSVRAGTSVANSSGDRGTDGTVSTTSNIAIPSNCSSIRCIIIGGGGGGSSGEANNTNYGGSGGAAGGARYIEINNINVSTISITVGNGGQSNLSSNDYPGPGGNGASSSITIGTSTYGVNGGKGGARSARGYAIPTSGTVYDISSNYTISNTSYIAGNITFPTGSARGDGLASTFPNGTSAGPNIYPYNINSTGYGTGGNGGDSVGGGTTPNDVGNFGTSGKGGFVRVYFMI